MATKDESKPMVTLMAAVGLVVILIVGGMWLQNVAISPPVASPLAKPLRPIPGTGTVRQTEASVSVPKVGSGATGMDASCQRFPEAQHVGTSSVCREVVVAGIPAGSQVRAVKPYVKEPGTADWRPCEPGGDGPFMSCHIENFRFLSLNPAIVAGPNGVTVTWTAMNSSTERGRDAQLLVEYAPPPPSPTSPLRSE